MQLRACCNFDVCDVNRWLYYLGINSFLLAGGDIVVQKNLSESQMGNLITEQQCWNLECAYSWSLKEGSANNACGLLRY